MGMTINETAKAAHRAAHRKGFYFRKCQPPCRHLSGSRAGAIMLIVTELAEAVEADRTGDMDTFREEIADAAIRLFDLAEAEAVDLEAEIALKMFHNQNRPRRHGKKY